MTNLSPGQWAALLIIAALYVAVIRTLRRFERQDRVLRGLSREWRGEEDR